MTYRRPARRAPRRIPRLLVSAVPIVIAALAALLSHGSFTSSSSTAAVPDFLLSEHRGRPGDLPPLRSEHRGDENPEVDNLDPDLLGALRQAEADAAADGVEFTINSGWRSAEYQEHLFREAVSEYGSEEEAARWVATADTSPHVSGDAVDIGPAEAAAWLTEHGADYGLCQIYDNEPWHFELRADAIDGGCPAMYADPTDDPRMQQ
jgi:zinc D-Ala-D-Ala carboxypeptidase